MRDGGDVGGAFDLLYQQIVLHTPDGAIALNLFVPKPGEEFAQLFEAVRVGIVKLCKLRDDALGIGIAAIEFPHELHAQAPAAKPGHDGKVLEIHIAVEVFRQHDGVARVHAALLLPENQKVDAAVGDALVHGESADQLLGIEIGLHQGIIALHLPMPDLY